MRRSLLIALLVLAAACGDAAGVEPAARAVAVETTGCGFAADRSGSGIATGGDLVVTVAHLVVRAEDVSVVTRAGQRLAAGVVALDTRSDVAVLRVEGLDMAPAEYSSAAAGDAGAIVAAERVAYEVLEVVDISIEEVLGTERFSRRGYKLDAATGTGDSGAGMYDADGAVVGMVFAVSADGDATWATSSRVVQRMLDGLVPEELRCDPDRSRIG